MTNYNLQTTYGDREGIVVAVDDTGVKLKLYVTFSSSFLPLFFVYRLFAFTSNTYIFHRPDGKVFTVPAQDVRIPMPSVGDVVTFSFDSYARRDLPVNPKIYRIRTDISWDDAQHSYAKEKHYLSGKLCCPRFVIILMFFSEHLSLPGFTTQPVGHWTAKNMRAFLENYASQRGLNPLLAETWYNVPRTIFNHFAVPHLPSLPFCFHLLISFFRM